MNGTDATLASFFVSGVFGPSTEGPVYISSLPNTAEDRDAGEPGEKHVMTRDSATVARFIEKWDRPRRGLFFCVSTLREGAARRSKEDVKQTNILFVDVDFKAIIGGEAGVLASLEVLPSRPSIVVRSGNGLHLYWLLKEAVDVSCAEGVARAEMVLRQLADVVGGDLGVAEVARLMRLPGTHNTKGGALAPVTILRADYEARHLLENVEDMLAYMSPLVKRRAASAEQAHPPENPFLAAARRLGFKPPVDVETRLRAMSYQGAGDAAIHQTQISVSAALLVRGEPVETVVASVLDATRAAAGEFGERWNWAREDRAVRRMCEDWVRKNPPPAQTERLKSLDEFAGVSAKTATDRAAAAKVVRLADHRPKAKPRSAGKTPLHIVVGTAVLEALEHRGEQLLVTSGQVWRYADGLWSSPTLEGRRWLEVTIETACRALGLDSTAKLVNETRQWVLRHPDLYVDEVEWDAHLRISTRSGLVDRRSLDVVPAAAAHRATWRIECAFDATAGCPWWERMLADFFADRTPGARDELVATIQEMLGVALIEDKPKALTKALILQGGSDSGKTSVLEVLGGLLSAAPISMALDAIGGTHGLMEFTRRAPWVVHEAFEQSKWHFSSLVKSILTGDPVQINVKNGPLVTKRVRAPVFWGTNHPPQFKEATRAIVNRLVVIHCRQVFDESNPIGVAVEARRRGYSEPSRFILDTEIPGLLNWAVAGLNRALSRGHFLLGDELRATREEIRSDSNLVDGFIRECVDLDEDRMIATQDFCAAFDAWWRENKGEDRRSPSNDSVGRAMAAFGDPRIVLQRDNERRYYCGLRLRDVGLDYWNSTKEGGNATGKATRLAATSAGVNRSIPSSWSKRDDIARMRGAFAARPPPEGAQSSNDERDTSLGRSVIRDTRSVTSREPQF